MCNMNVASYTLSSESQIPWLQEYYPSVQQLAAPATRSKCYSKGHAVLSGPPQPVPKLIRRLIMIYIEWQSVSTGAMSCIYCSTVCWWGNWWGYQLHL